MARFYSTKRINPASFLCCSKGCPLADNLAVKDATGTSKTLQTTDNASVHLPAHQIVNADGTGALKILAEDDAHSSADTGIMTLAVRQGTPGNLSGSDGDYEPLQVSAGRLWASAIITAMTPGTGATDLGKAEDAAHTTGDVGVMSLGVRNDTHTTALAGSNGDYTPIGVDSSGKIGIRGTFAEDAAHTTGDLGVQTLTVRQDTAAALGGTDADYQPLITDGSGRLHVNVGAFSPGSAAGSLGKAEDAAHNTGDTGVFVLAVRSDTAAATGGTDGDYVALTTDSTGRLWAHVSAVEPGTGATSLGKAEDAAHTSADVGVMGLAVRQDTPGNLSGTDGDYEPLQVSAGRLWTSTTITALVPGVAATSLGKAEDAAHTTGDTGVMALAVANATHTTALSGTDGDYTPLAVDTTGKLGIRGTYAEDSAHTTADLGVFTLAVANATHTNALTGTDGDYTPIAVDTTGKVGIRGTFAEDAAHTTGDLGLFVLAKRTDTAAVSGGTDADYCSFNVDASGCLWTHVNAITAGETHIGEMAEWHQVVSVTPTIDTAIYATGDAVGGKQTLTSAARVSGGVVVLDSLTMVDKGNQKAACDILFFDADPTAATITNNAPFVYSTDISKLIGSVHIATSDWVTIDSIAHAIIKNIGLTLKASGSANLFAAVVGTGTPTYTSTGDLIFKYGFRQ